MKRAVIARITEDSGTVVASLIPWSPAGVLVAGTLGVPTPTSLPFAFMCYLGMAFSLFYGWTGSAVAKRVREDETVPGSRRAAE
jgi:Na+:H+ antiporter, NhaC family